MGTEVGVDDTSRAIGVDVETTETSTHARTPKMLVSLSEDSFLEDENRHAITCLQPIWTLSRPTTNMP